MRVGDLFQQAHGIGNFFSIGALNVFSARNAVTVFAAHRAAQRHGQCKDLFADAPHGADAFARLHVQHRADMQTARRGVGINSAVRAVRFENALHFADEISQPFNGDGAIFDEGNWSRRLRT
jgi:hypothetical protein